MRIGHGYDAHALVEGRPLVLAGLEIPFEKGLTAHSDGDVVIHALCDALLGAAGQGDIGRHFPEDDPQYQGIESRILLRRVTELLNRQGLTVLNADTTVIAVRPKLASYLGSMEACLAQELGVGICQINVKATTTEWMGFIGRGEGIAAHAVVLLQ